jgi:hypothetical protein
MWYTSAGGWARRVAVRVLALALVLAGLTTLAGHEKSAPPAAEPAAVSTSQIGVTPPSMGWASWNSFASSIDFDVIKEQTDALVSSDMAAAGYQYVTSTTAGGRATVTATAASPSTPVCGRAA